MAMYKGSVKDKKIIYGWDDRTNVYLMFRENGVKQTAKIEDYPWHFCVDLMHKAKAMPIIMKYMTTANVVKRFEEKNGYIYIYCDKNSQLMSKFLDMLKFNGVPCLEKDLSLIKRYCVD